MTPPREIAVAAAPLLHRPSMRSSNAPRSRRAAAAPSIAATRSTRGRLRPSAMPGCRTISAKSATPRFASRASQAPGVATTLTKRSTWSTAAGRRSRSVMRCRRPTVRCPWRWSRSTSKRYSRESSSPWRGRPERRPRPSLDRERRVNCDAPALVPDRPASSPPGGPGARRPPDRIPCHGHRRAALRRPREAGRGRDPFLRRRGARRDRGRRDLRRGEQRGLPAPRRVYFRRQPGARCGG